MVLRPTQLPQWATSDIQDPISDQYNVVEPPSERKLTGWTLKEKPNRQWWNWLLRQTYLFLQWFDQQSSLQVTTDGNGVGLFTKDNSLITLYAIDLDNPTSYLVAVGSKTAGNAPVLNVIGFNTLVPGVGTVTGNQPVTGGTNIRILGTTGLIPTP